MMTRIPLIPMLLAATAMATALAACGGSEEPTIQETRPAEQGQRGESCRARNDCIEGLACINSTCVQNEYPIEPTAKACELIECSINRDCCDTTDAVACAEYEAACPLAPGYDRACEALETACAGEDFEACNAFNAGCGCYSTRRACNEGDTFACDSVEFSCTDTFACDQYLSECTCVDTCFDSVCLSAVACFDDEDCFGGTCAAGTCDFRCSTDEDCGDGDQCIDGACITGCIDRNECGPFQDCVAGSCVDVGCTTDRECAAFADNGLATCNTGECVVPCLNDAECNGSGYDFQACVEGSCRYVGCETDEECFLAMTRDFGSLPPGVSAICGDGL